VPLYSVQVFDRVLRSGSMETLAMLTLALAVVLATQCAFEAIRARMMHRIGEWAEESLLPDVALLVPASGHDRNLIADLRNVRAFISGPGALALIDLPWLPLFVAAAFLLHPVVGWFTVGTAVALFALTLLNEFLTRRRAEAAAAAQGVVMGRLAELSRKHDAATGLSMRAPFIAREMSANTEANTQARVVADIQSTMSAVSKTVRVGSQTLVMGLAAVLVLDHEVSAGATLAASILLGRALLPIDSALAGWRQFQSARDGWRRLKLAFAEWKGAVGTTLPTPDGELEIEAATFVVGGNKRLVENVSFRLNAGTCVAVVGPSGSGKSTLCRMLVGAIQPTIGTIRMDGAAIGDWTEEQRRLHIGYLPQDLSLFAGSVKDNIARFSEADDLDVVAAAAKANCDPLIRSLPGNYDFVLGEGGAPLSGGQRQRLALARALFGIPKLVVLDEPNSNLDIDGDMALARTIKSLKASGATVVLVTHRPSLVAEADLIAVMNAGRLVHFGGAGETMSKLDSVAAQVRANAPPKAA
jgi:PrtD family type I secretion system ABC transporter